MESRLRIAHVDAERGFSGGEVQVFLLMDGLARRGHGNLLLCPPGSRSAEQARARGIETRAVAMRADLDLVAVLRLARVLARERPDLVHLHTGRATWLGGIAARIARIPALTTRRMDRRVKRGWRTRLIYGGLVRGAIAISPAVAECLREAGVPCPVELVPSAVEPGSLVPMRGREEVRAELGIEAGETVVLALVSLVPRKGIDVLLDALAELARRGCAPRALVAGDGPERAALEGRARALGLGRSVRFLGRRADRAELLAACDLFVLPSRREGLGVAALEAMACARAVVASRVGGLAEAVVDGRTGLLVPPGAPGPLAAAIERLILDPDLRRRLGAAGPARVSEGFLAEQMVDAHETLYRRVLEGEGS